MRHAPEPSNVLTNVAYRNLWAASIVSNFGTFMLMVGAAWAMVGLGEGPLLITLVQSAIVAPILVFGVAAGTLADLYDRRRVAIFALILGLVGSLGLVALSLSGALSAWLLLLCCFLVGTGNAIFSPAWQTAVAEQVTDAQLPQAIMLNSVSYNLARSAGPGAGGLLVALTGPVGGFAFNCFSFVPVLLAFLFWRVEFRQSTLPRERLGRAFAAGIRYVAHNAPLRIAAFRAFIAGLTGCALAALAPLVARDVLQGGSGTFGFLLAALGVGSVIGAFGQSKLRVRFGPENASKLLTFAGAGGSVLAAFSSSVIWCCVGYLIAGIGIAGTSALLNVFFQTNSPRWVSARTLATFQSVFAGGMTVGGFIWGAMADRMGLVASLEIVAVSFAAIALVGVVFPIIVPDDGVRDDQPELPAAIINSDLVPIDAGPIIVEIHYHVPDAAEPDFQSMMREVRSARLRNGARDWTLRRDVTDGSHWVQRFSCVDGRDYLHLRERSTRTERLLHADVAKLTTDGRQPVVKVFVQDC